MLIRLLNFIFNTGPEDIDIDIDISAFYKKHVRFYTLLSADEQVTFEKRALAFINTTEIIGHELSVTHEDRLLIAASAIIPVWKFPGWHYFSLQRVILVAGPFNKQREINKSDSRIQGMVTDHSFGAYMILSKPALYHGFSNDQDKRNVGIHEFVHLLDLADGTCDGFPERLSEYSFSLPWLNMVREKISEIEQGQNKINPYGATNEQEFFAVASEYFFEQPRLLKHKHPTLYNVLSEFYEHNMAEIDRDIGPRRKAPCPCGSGKKYKNCCEPEG